jgi:hypothetical protein
VHLSESSNGWWNFENLSIQAIYEIREGHGHSDSDARRIVFAASVALLWSCNKLIAENGIQASRLTLARTFRTAGMRNSRTLKRWHRWWEQSSQAAWATEEKNANALTGTLKSKETILSPIWIHKSGYQFCSIFYVLKCPWGLLLSWKGQILRSLCPLGQLLSWKGQFFTFPSW